MKTLKSYQVFLNKECIGGIWQELPEDYPNDWTIGIKTIPYNHVAPLENCKKVVLEKHPDAKIKKYTEYRNEPA